MCWRKRFLELSLKPAKNLSKRLSVARRPMKSSTTAAIASYPPSRAYSDFFSCDRLAFGTDLVTEDCAAANTGSATDKQTARVSFFMIDLLRWRFEISEFLRPPSHGRATVPIRLELCLTVRLLVRSNLPGRHVY